MRVRSALPRTPWGLAWFGCLPLLCLAVLLPAAAWSQSAAVTLTEAVATNAAYVNGGGFAIVSDGSLRYEGPLNAVLPLPTVDSARIVINDVVLIDGVPLAVQDLVERGESRANTLSPELVNARVDLSGRNAIALGMGGQVPTYVELGGSLESRRSVVVSGQSFSIFADFAPSVFNRTIVP